MQELVRALVDHGERAAVALGVLYAASCGNTVIQPDPAAIDRGEPPRSSSRAHGAHDASHARAQADAGVAILRDAQTYAEPAPHRQGRPIRVMRGRISYYHDSLAGHHTASGEPYEPRDFTAANRTLPFGSIVRVSRVDGSRTVTVRVNDRGPFGRRRLLFVLSRAAAEKLEMVSRGIMEARIEVLELGEREPRRRHARRAAGGRARRARSR